jgi:hypothetical protein
MGNLLSPCEVGKTFKILYSKALFESELAQPYGSTDLVSYRTINRKRWKTDAILPLCEKKLTGKVVGEGNGFSQTVGGSCRICFDRD